MRKAYFKVTQLTLILKFDKGVVKISHHDQELCFYVKTFKSHSLIRQRHTVTHRQYENITFPHVDLSSKGLSSYVIKLHIEPRLESIDKS